VIEAFLMDSEYRGRIKARNHRRRRGVSLNIMRSLRFGLAAAIYPSAKGTPVAAFIHPFGPLYPLPVTPLIVKFLQEHPRTG
jgi:hypothetical protein